MANRARPRVVYALDERPASRSSLSQVAFFAQLYDAELLVLRVTRVTRSASTPAHSAAAAVEAVAPLAARVVERRGAARPTIVDYARSHHATLLAVDARFGARSGRGVSTTVSRLGRSAPCPLLVLPRPKRGKARVAAGIGEVLCALDHGPAATATLETALDMARRARARLTLVHALQGLPVPAAISGMQALRVVRQLDALTASERERLSRLVPARVAGGLEIRYVVRTGDAWRAILQASVEAGAQLIVMGVVPRNLIDDVLIGSTSGPVLRRAGVPVVLVPALAPTSRTHRRPRSGQPPRPRVDRA